MVENICAKEGCDNLRKGKGRSKKGKQWFGRHCYKHSHTRYYLDNRSIITLNRKRNKIDGVTSLTYDFLLKEQKGKCKICGVIPEHKLLVDHDHKTNKLRGLLCRNCNWGLGHFRDDTLILKKAREYLA